MHSLAKVGLHSRSHTFISPHAFCAHHQFHQIKFKQLRVSFPDCSCLPSLSRFANILFYHFSSSVAIPFKLHRVSNLNGSRPSFCNVSSIIPALLGRICTTWSMVLSHSHSREIWNPCAVAHTLAHKHSLFPKTNARRFPNNRAS